MTNEYFQEIKGFREQLVRIGQIPEGFLRPATLYQPKKLTDILEGLHIEDYPVQFQIISEAKKELFMGTSIKQLFLNPIALGKIISCLDAIIAEETVPSLWNCVHPRIKAVSMRQFLNRDYADAAVNAFIEINDAVKEVYKKHYPGEKVPDGVNLMHKAFGSPDGLKLGDDTETGKNIQQGFHLMFAGAISAFRNPKAHSNKETITAGEAMRRIAFASSLLYKLDELPPSR